MKRQRELGWRYRLHYLNSRNPCGRKGREITNDRQCSLLNLKQNRYPNLCKSVNQPQILHLTLVWLPPTSWYSAPLCVGAPYFTRLWSSLNQRSTNATTSSSLHHYVSSSHSHASFSSVSSSSYTLSSLHFSIC